MTYTIEALKREEEETALDGFDYTVVWRLGSLMREAAARGHKPVAIQITHGLDPIFLSVLPGATADNVEWIRRKTATAQRFHQSTLRLQLASAAGGYDFNQRYRLSESEFVAAGGAVPLFVHGAGMVGVAAVSGLPSTEDHEMVVEALKELKRSSAIQQGN